MPGNRYIPRPETQPLACLTAHAESLSFDLIQPYELVPTDWLCGNRWPENNKDASSTNPERSNIWHS